MNVTWDIRILVASRCPSVLVCPLRMRSISLNHLFSNSCNVNVVNKGGKGDVTVKGIIFVDT